MGSKNHIVLVGLPGVGKTSAGKSLSKMLDGIHVDIDQEIQKDQEISISDLINQNLTIAQAANIGANISSHCQKCGAKNIKTAAYILQNFPKHANDCLSQIRTVCSNTKCLGKIIVLKYTSSKTKL